MSTEPAHDPLKILIAASEAVPWAKTGGLADVVGALSVELANLGHEVYLVIPRYRWAPSGSYTFKEFARLSVPTPAGSIDTVVEQAVVSHPSPRSSGSLTVLAIRYGAFFDRAELYQEGGRDYPDNLDRFSYFCRAVMELLLLLSHLCRWRPNVVHLHDWQTSLCAVYLKTLYASYTELEGIRSVLTLHNIGYQGIFPASEYWKLSLPSAFFSVSALEYYGSINLLKGGIVFADFLTTVSPTYSQEIQSAEFGFGLDGVIRERRNSLRGIVNGIDTDIWNPESDSFLESHYSVSALNGKQKCKKQLQHLMQLPQKKVILVGVIARLTPQKGLDLVLNIMHEITAMDLQLVILGAGEQVYSDRLKEFSETYPDRVAFRNGFDERLAHVIEAGADLLLMPSRYEPCGLSQLYSLRYGTVPLVRKTGGLTDTVIPYTPCNVKLHRATGFMFHEIDSHALLNALLLAATVYEKKALWRILMTTGMRQDYSWAKSAAAYIDLFRDVIDGVSEDSACS